MDDSRSDPAQYGPRLPPDARRALTGAGRPGRDAVVTRSAPVHTVRPPEVPMPSSARAAQRRFPRDPPRPSPHPRAPRPARPPGRLRRRLRGLRRRQAPRGRWTHRDAIAEVRRREEGFVWIGLHEPDAEQITDIAEVFGLHPLAVEDARARPPAPEDRALRRHAVLGVQDDALRRARLADDGQRDRRVGRAHGLPGPRLRRHRPPRPALRAAPRAPQLEADPEHLAQGPAVVLHAVADHIVDAYLACPRASRATSTRWRRGLRAVQRGRRRADLPDEARGPRAAPRASPRW